MGILREQGTCEDVGEQYVIITYTHVLHSAITCVICVYMYVGIHVHTHTYLLHLHTPYYLFPKVQTLKTWSPGQQCWEVEAKAEFLLFWC